MIGLGLMLLGPAASGQPASQIVVNVLDTKVLAALEDGGFSLSEALGGAKASLTAEMYRANPRYRSFADVIGRPLPHDPATDQLPADIPASSGDVPDMVRLIRNFEDKGKRSEKDLKGGFFIRHLSNNSQYPYAVEYDGDEPRHFDTRWLNSGFGAMKLVGVVNRMDRVDFDPSSCGEVRFIYRLSYHAPQSSSSLPFFVNVVKRYPKQADCSAFAKRWRLPRGAGPEQTATALREGPLKDLAFKQMEVNFQSLRFTSGYMHDFGGQAMYMQRIFRPKGDKLEPIPLENTPDVLAVEADPSLLTRFIAWLKEGDRLERLDNGTLVVDFDDRFLTRFSVSWSTLGRARTANKPYSRLFEDKRALLDSIDISRLKFVKSRDALVERLNNLTCMGCHQSGGMAGFHLVGHADDRYSHDFNRQQTALSPHAAAEEARRLAYVENLAAGREPHRFRPHSNFTSADWIASGPPRFESASVGHLCAIPGAFAGAPSCAPVDGQSTACERTVTSKDGPVLFGECVVKGGRAFAGAVCWKGEVTEVASLPRDRGPIPSYNLFAFQDKWRLQGSTYGGSELKGLRCVLPQSGAPLGRSSRSCTLAEENFDGLDLAKHVPAELCANQGGNGFDLCAAAGNSGACLEARVARGMLDTCSPKKACREDYICQKVPDYHLISEKDYGNIRPTGRRTNLSTPSRIRGEAIKALHDAEIGFCVPTYFLFNMRLDGHPSPVTGKPPGKPRFDRTQPLRGYP
jgi:hypothetical protein